MVGNHVPERRRGAAELVPRPDVHLLVEVTRSDASRRARNGTKRPSDRARQDEPKSQEEEYGGAQNSKQYRHRVMQAGESLCL